MSFFPLVLFTAAGFEDSFGTALLFCARSFLLEVFALVLFAPALFFLILRGITVSFFFTEAAPFFGAASFLGAAFAFGAAFLTPSVFEAAAAFKAADPFFLTGF
ncbi:MAG TPA: hypothetical protein VHO43_14960 [Ignavibacteriales bacterium]|nr:hypothetical protein [Ignavibacteriales bacterium]